MSGNIRMGEIFFFLSRACRLGHEYVELQCVSSLSHWKEGTWGPASSQHLFDSKFD